jgi:hypothetical protein
LPDGRIAVPNGATAEVRIFDSAGRYLSAVGRRGEGPGEFRSPWHILEWPGDSLLVLDISRGFRFNIFGPDGAFVRSFTTPVATGAEGTEMIGWFLDGSSLVRRHEFGPEPATTRPYRTHISLFRLGADGAKLDSLGRFPEQTVTSSGLYLWGPRAFEAVHDSTVYYGAGDTYEIQRYTMHGALRGIIRRSRPSTPTTAADFESFKAEALKRESAAGGDPRRRVIAEERVARATYASTFPSYFYLQTDEPGNLWAQEYSPRVGEGRVWSVFDPAGIYLGDVEMPERFRVFQIGDDFVLGQWADADDVEHVRVYPLIKPSQGGESRDGR